MTVQEFINLIHVNNTSFDSCIVYKDGSISGFYPQWGAVDNNNAKLNVSRVKVQEYHNNLYFLICTDNCNNKNDN